MCSPHSQDVICLFLSEETILSTRLKRNAWPGHKGISGGLVGSLLLARLQDQVGQSEIIPPANCNERIFEGVD